MALILLVIHDLGFLSSNGLVWNRLLHLGMDGSLNLFHMVWMSVVATCYLNYSLNF